MNFSKPSNILTAVFIILVLSSKVCFSEWGIGLLGYDYQGSQINIDKQLGLIPFVYYEGDRFSASMEGVSYKLTESESTQLNAIGTFRLQNYDPNDSDFLTGMEKRKSTLEAGFDAAFGNLRFSAVMDIGGTHKGQEISADYIYSTQIDNWMIKAAAGISWQSNKLTNYYYGVKPSEASLISINGVTLNRYAYTVDDAVIQRIGVKTMYKISDRWLAIVAAQYIFLPNKIQDSPIVNKNGEWGAFSGIAYKFE